MKKVEVFRLVNTGRVPPVVLSWIHHFRGEKTYYPWNVDDFTEEDGQLPVWVVTYSKTGRWHRDENDATFVFAWCVPFKATHPELYCYVILRGKEFTMTHFPIAGLGGYDDPEQIDRNTHDDDFWRAHNLHKVASDLEMTFNELRDLIYGALKHSFLRLVHESHRGDHS